LNTQLNINRTTRQRNLAAVTALLLMVGTSVSAVAASTTYVCVNKATSLVYFKAKCTKAERRVAISNTTVNTATAIKGESAYETWLKGGHLGTTEEFLRSLRGTDGSAGQTGQTGPAGSNGSSANLPFFQRLESSLTCDEKWRTVATSVYAGNQAGVDRQQALAGCPQPDWAKQYFQFPDANPITLVSTSYGTPTLANQQIRRNGVLVDDLYAPKKTTVSFSAVVAIQPPTGWAVCTDADAQITALGETGYPKITYDGSSATTTFVISNNRATVMGSFSVVDTDQLRTSFYDLWLTTYICGPDASTPSGLGRKSVSTNLFLPEVNP
jgi:hypothetical protein